MSKSSALPSRLMGMVDRAISGVDLELTKARRGDLAVDGVSQLEYIVSQLKAMRGRLDGSSVDMSEAFKPGIARIVVDTWPLTDPLGELIVEVEYEWNRRHVAR